MTQKRGILMPEIDVSDLKSMKRILTKEAEAGISRKIGVIRWKDRHSVIRQRLDETLLAFRVARRSLGEEEGWLRSVRHAVGVRVEEVARRLGVSRWEIFRLENAEKESRIQLGSLRRAAEALGCELVYALVPREGTLEEMAAEQKAAREAAWTEAFERLQAEEKARKGAVLVKLGWRGAMSKAIRRSLRKEGIRIR